MTSNTTNSGARLSETAEVFNGMLPFKAEVNLSTANFKRAVGRPKSIVSKDANKPIILDSLTTVSIHGDDEYPARGYLIAKCAKGVGLLPAALDLMLNDNLSQPLSMQTRIGATYNNDGIKRYFVLAGMEVVEYNSYARMRNAASGATTGSAGRALLPIVLVEYFIAVLPGGEQVILDSVTGVSKLIDEVENTTQVSVTNNGSRYALPARARKVSKGKGKGKGKIKAVKEEVETSS